jgi:hypothetical protein
MKLEFQSDMQCLFFSSSGHPVLFCTRYCKMTGHGRSGRKGDEIPELSFVLTSEYKMAEATQIAIGRVVAWGRLHDSHVEDASFKETGGYSNRQICFLTCIVSSHHAPQHINRAR